MELLDFFVVLGICVLMPVLIVWIIARVRKNEADHKAEIMLKAIEAGVPIDPEMFKKPAKRQKTTKEDLLERLNGACITTFMGVALLAAGIVFSVCPVGYIFLPPNMMIVGGSILLAIGLGLFVVYFTGKKMLAKELESE